MSLNFEVDAISAGGITTVSIRIQSKTWPVALIAIVSLLTVVG